MVINGLEFLSLSYRFIHRFSFSLLLFIFMVGKFFLESFPAIMKGLGEGLEFGLLFFKLQILLDPLEPRDELTVRLTHSI